MYYFNRKFGYDVNRPILRLGIAIFARIKKWRRTRSESKLGGNVLGGILTYPRRYRGLYRLRADREYHRQEKYYAIYCRTLDHRLGDDSLRNNIVGNLITFTSAKHIRASRITNSVRCPEYFGDWRFDHAIDHYMLILFFLSVNCTSYQYNPIMYVIPHTMTGFLDQISKFNFIAIWRIKFFTADNI